MNLKTMLCGLLVSSIVGTVQAGDLVPFRKIGTDLATDLARAALGACRKSGYQVSVVVVDRSGDPVVLLRDDLASRHTIEIATRKAGAVILSGTDSGALARTRAAIAPQLNEMQGVILMRGGLPIRAAGALVGAIGVAGAPGGHKDEACARAGLEAVEERLEFSD